MPYAFEVVLKAGSPLFIPKGKPVLVAFLLYFVVDYWLWRPKLSIFFGSLLENWRELWSFSFGFVGYLNSFTGCF